MPTLMNALERYFAHPELPWKSVAQPLELEGDIAASADQKVFSSGDYNYATLFPF